jgi:hypothetical protein
MGSTSAEKLTMPPSAAGASGNGVSVGVIVGDGVDVLVGAGVSVAVGV